MSDASQAAGTQKETPGRGQDGRFLPGNKFKPPTAHRKALPELRDLQKAVVEKAPPDRIARVVDELLDSQSDKIRLATIQWLHDILFGKPVQRQITATDTVENFMAMMRGVREAEEEAEGGEDNVVEVEGRVVDGPQTGG